MVIYRFDSRLRSSQDAYDEDKEGQEINKRQMSGMDEGDFFDSGPESDSDEEDFKGASAGATKLRAKQHDVVALSLPEKLALLQKRSPHLPPTLEYLKKKVGGLRSFLPVLAAVQGESPGALGTNEAGYEYLRLRAALGLSTVINATLYLALLTSGSLTAREVEGHPVVARLNEIEAVSSRVSKIEERDGLEWQVGKVREALEVMKEGGVEGSEEEEEEELEVEVEGGEGDVEEDEEEKEGVDDEGAGDEGEGDRDSGDEADDDDLFDDEAGERALKAAKGNPKKRKAPVAAAAGDDEDGEDDDDTKAKAAIALMENDLAKYNDGLESDDFDGGVSDSDSSVGSDFDEAKVTLPSSSAAANLVHAAGKRSKDKKRIKSDTYAVAPKFPTADALTTGERVAGYRILKNRGLVAHKAKINRNPRVKKREQFRKAVIRRKGAVRDVRTGEAEGYAGEGTGIKSGLSRSKKLKS